MKLKLILPAVLAVGLWACSSDEPKQQIPELNTFELSRSEANMQVAVENFAFDLFATMAKDVDAAVEHAEYANFCVSPLSASIALAMVANSTDDACRDAIADMLKCDDMAALNSLYNKVIRMTCNDPNVDIKLANAIWYHNDYSVDDEFTTSIYDKFYAPVTGVDFKDVSSIGLINRWCADNTSGKIPQIIDESIIRHNPVIVMWLNALYAQGEWEKKFDPEFTHTDIFNGTKSIRYIKMMSSVKNRPYYDGDDYQAVTLDMKGSDNAFVFVLPDKDVDIAEFISGFNVSDWRAIMNSRKEMLVNVGLPRFEINTNCDIIKILNEMGMPLSAFLPPLNVEDEICLNAYQSTYTKIDEAGATVAAATDIVGKLTSYASPDLVELIFNRPFLYFMVNKTTGAILMAGRICEL